MAKNTINCLVLVGYNTKMGTFEIFDRDDYNAMCEAVEAEKAADKANENAMAVVSALDETQARG